MSNEAGRWVISPRTGARESQTFPSRVYRLAGFRTALGLFTLLSLEPLSLITGCKTSDDAMAAAAQMSTTAKALSDYYTAAGTTVANTDQLFSLEVQLLSKPYNPANQKLIKDNASELAKRAELANDLATLADDFAKLTGSTASADVSAAAARCETEVDSLTSHNASTAEQSALKDALQVLVKTVQERKERESAKVIDQVAQDLTNFFVKEIPLWNSNELVYLQQTTEVANYLADHDGIDNTSFLKTALDPLNLTPSVASPELKAQLVPLTKQQIADRAAALNDAYQKATDAMTKSLQEMSQRIHLVAEDKPMGFRRPPITIATVEQWAAHVQAY